MEEIINTLDYIYSKNKIRESVNRYLFSNKDPKKGLFFKCIVSSLVIVNVIFIISVLQNTLLYTFLSMILYLSFSKFVSYVINKYFETNIDKKLELEFDVIDNSSKTKSAHYLIFKYSLLKQIPFNKKKYENIINWVEIYLSELQFPDFSSYIKPVFVITIPLIVAAFKDVVKEQPVYILILTTLGLIIALFYEFYKLFTNATANKYGQIIKYLKKMIIEEEILNG